MGSTDEGDYSLLANMMPFLDRHLIYPLLADEESTPELTKLKFELLKPTHMTDFVGGLEKELKGLKDVPKDYDRKKEEVLKQKAEYEEATEKIGSLLEDEDVISNLRSDKIANMKYLKTEHGATDEMVIALYDFGRFQYDCGAYDHAAELLYKFRVLSSDDTKLNAATWGKLASEILSTQWDQAMEEITKVKEIIDTRLSGNTRLQLDNRAWLLHWCLFPFFNHNEAKDTLVDMFFSAPYINTIQTMCPWILRYLTAAVITSRKRNKNSNAHQKHLKDLVRIIRQEGYEYSDPLTLFVKALYVDFDFEEAQKHLSTAETILKEDFFLTSSTEDFVDAARHLISESYCKIHQRIDIRDLSARLGLSDDEGEKWIVNLIRETRVDAKIDYQAGTVEMNHPPQSVYQQVIERTKGGFFRTQVLSAAVAK